MSKAKVISSIFVLSVCLGRILSTTGTRCYHCTVFDVNTACQTVATCASNEGCFISRVFDTHTGRGLSLWGCMQKQACDSFHQSLVGRRSSSSKEKCFICCDSDLCNSDCRTKTTTTQAPSTPSVCDDHLRSDICQAGALAICHNVTMATAIGCRKTCGFC